MPELQPRGATEPAGETKPSKSALERAIDWLVQLQAPYTRGPESEERRGLTDFRDSSELGHPQGVPIDPTQRQGGRPSAEDHQEAPVASTERSPLEELQGRPPSNGDEAEPVTMQELQNIADRHLSDPLRIAPQDPNPIESLRGAAEREGRLSEVDHEIQIARGAQLGGIPSLDGAVHTLKDGNRSFGPDQPLTTVIGGIGNSTSENQRFLKQVGELLPNEGVSGVFNVRPGDESIGGIDSATDLGKAMETRWPDVPTKAQLGEIGTRHLSRVDVPPGFGNPLLAGPRESLELLRVNAKREGKSAEVERAIEGAVYENQVRANPSITAAQRLQEWKIRQHQDHRMLVHSEGEIIASVATKKTISNIENDPTLTPLQRSEMLRRIHVDSFGGAADSKVIQQFEGRIGSWTRYRDPRDPVPRVAARPADDRSDDTPLGGVRSGAQDQHSWDFSTHHRDAYMEFVKQQGPGYLRKSRGTRGQIREILIRVR